MKILTTKEILKKYALRTNGDMALLDIEECPSKLVSNEKWITVDSLLKYLDSYDGSKIALYLISDIVSKIEKDMETSEEKPSNVRAR